MEDTVLIVHFGELTLKGKNYHYFSSLLLKNIKQKLKIYKSFIEYIKEHQRLYLKILNLDFLNKILADLKTVFGIYSISIAKKCDNDINKIENISRNIFENIFNKTFKIEAKRLNKNFPLTSLEIKKCIGSSILKIYKNKVSVDVIKPDIILMIEVRNNFTLVYHSTIKAFGGLPYGSSNTGLSMISGGIDSPVASFLMMKKGIKLKFIYFATPPHTDEKSLKKVLELIANLKHYSNNLEQKLYVVNFSLMQNEIMHISNSSYRITIMRRMFYRIANVLANKLNCSAIITGESLGQVASQTIESISVINEVSNLPVLRPLISYDKSEIIDIAKDINTYDISILPFEDCCSLFVPKNPTTKPKSSIAINQENDFLFKEIIDVIVNNHIQEFII